MDVTNSPTFEDLIQKLKDDLLVGQERLMKDQKALKQSLEEELKKSKEKQIELEKLTAEQLALKEELEKEKTALTQEKSRWNEEKSSWIALEKKLDATQITDPVVLNVGGEKFHCSADTLRKFPDTYFSALVSGRWELKKGTDEAIFIDQDPDTFRLILSFLRMCGPYAEVVRWASSLPTTQKILFEHQLKFFSLPLFAPICLSEHEWSQILTAAKCNTRVRTESLTIHSTISHSILYGENYDRKLLLVRTAEGVYGACRWYRRDFQPQMLDLFVLSKIGEELSLSHHSVLYDYGNRMLGLRFPGLEIYIDWTLRRGEDSDWEHSPLEGTPILSFEVWELKD